MIREFLFKIKLEQISIPAELTTKDVFFRQDQIFSSRADVI